MQIGIVTPAYNVAPYLGEAIGSVLAQTHRDWTLTIVDDGSTDNTAAVAGGFADARIQLIRQCNAGVSAARNRGVGATSADAILFLDGDDWLSPHALSTLSAALRAGPNAVAAAGPYARVRNGNSSGGRVRSPPSGDLLEPLLVRNLFANGGHLLIRRRAVAAAGLFQTRLSYGEDWEYWIRLACLGGFVAAGSRTPLLFVRERAGSAYLGMALRPESFAPCMDAIFGNPALRVRLSLDTISRLRRRAEAENDWIVGREMIRHGRLAEGRRFLRRSVWRAPSFRRLVLLAAGMLPAAPIGPFRPYPAADPL
jgi:glycosyltransferase involved in cell wall biosynthesis